MATNGINGTSGGIPEYNLRELNTADAQQANNTIFDAVKKADECYNNANMDHKFDENEVSMLQQWITTIDDIITVIKDNVREKCKSSIQNALNFVTRAMRAANISPSDFFMNSMQSNAQNTAVETNSYDESTAQRVIENSETAWEMPSEGEPVSEPDSKDAELNAQQEQEAKEQEEMQQLITNGPRFGQSQKKLQEAYESQIQSRVKDGNWAALAGPNGLIDKFIINYASNGEQVGLGKKSKYRGPSLGPNDKGLWDTQVAALRKLQKYAEAQVEQARQENLNGMGYQPPSQEMADAVGRARLNGGGSHDLVADLDVVYPERE